MSIKVTGTDAWHRGLRGGLDGRAIAAAAAAPIAARARQVAPRRSGELRRSIEVAATGRGRTVTVIARAGHANLVSYGSIHNPNPVPFLDIAVDDTTAEVQSAVEREVDAQLRRRGLT